MTEIEPALLAELLREALREGKSPFLTVVSNSMSPLIRRGDQIQLAPVTAEQLQPGDIIVFTGPANLITHRYWGLLFQQGQPRLLTRGDRPQHFDNPIAAASLVGQVIGRRRRQRCIYLNNGAGKWLNNHLAALARLEIRLFAQSPAPALVSEVQLSLAGGQPSVASNSLLVRLIRRFLYCWAIILTMTVSTIVLAFNKKKED